MTTLSNGRFERTNKDIERIEKTLDKFADKIENKFEKFKDAQTAQNEKISLALGHLPCKEDFKKLEDGLEKLERQQGVNDQKILTVQKLSFLFVSMIITITVGLVFLFFRTKIFT